ncbi:MAG: hypothetical protein H7Y04_12965 [Verrucomicrobia bacterium]|nr:hypothetical protein [Cytophagales bacterium]
MKNENLHQMNATDSGFEAYFPFSAYFLIGLNYYFYNLQLAVNEILMFILHGINLLDGTTS